VVTFEPRAIFIYIHRLVVHSSGERKSWACA
jgi:hypothetical protein